MDITHDFTCTLRAEAHHPPCVMEAAGFCTEHSAKARSIGYEEEMSPTLRAGVVPAAVYENHGQDTRFTFSGDVAPTVLATYGTGGNNQPFVVNPPLTKSWDGGDISPTLTANNAGGNQRMPDKDNFNCVIEAYGICSKESNSMKSDNPHSGVYKTDTSRTLDSGCGNPSCNQGGIAVVEGVPFTQNQRDEVRLLGDKSGALCKAATKQQTYILQGSMIGRKVENGPQGDGVNEDVSFTLNTADRHAVYAMTTGSSSQVAREQAPTLLARDYKDPTFVAEPSYGIGRDAFNQGKNALYKPAIEEELQPTLVAKGPGAVASAAPEYTVRRLTPTECAKLQGFPSLWCSDLGTENPTEEDISFWTEVFETYRKAIGKSTRPKSRNQIIKWLKNPHSDSAEYKMWGNGIALPCVCFVLSGIVWANK